MSIKERSKRASTNSQHREYPGRPLVPAKKKAQRSISESLEGSDPQPYVVPETAIRDLVFNLRIREAYDAGMCLLVIGEAVKAIVKDKTDIGGLNLRVIKQLAGGEKCRPIKPIVEAIIVAIGQGAEGIYAACLTITRFLEFAFEFAPDQRTAEGLYQARLRKIRKAARSSR